MSVRGIKPVRRERSRFARLGCELVGLAYFDGREARAEGVDRKGNPCADPDQRAAWDAGWQREHQQEAEACF